MFVRISGLCSVFLATVISANAFDQDKVEAAIRECATSTGTDIKDINYSVLSTPPENVLCMAKCFFEKVDFVDSDGKIMKEPLTDFMSRWPEEMKTAALECADKIKTVSSCNDMEEYRKCIQPTASKLQ